MIFPGDFGCKAVMDPRQVFFYKWGKGKKTGDVARGSNTDWSMVDYNSDNDCDASRETFACLDLLFLCHLPSRKEYLNMHR